MGQGLRNALQVKYLAKADLFFRPKKKKADLFSEQA